MTAVIHNRMNAAGLVSRPNTSRTGVEISIDVARYVANFRREKRQLILVGEQGERYSKIWNLCTAENRLHPEDESRVISVHMDESPERVGEALRSQLSRTLPESSRTIRASV